MNRTASILLAALILIICAAHAEEGIDSSLWGKAITAEIVALPSEAFDQTLIDPFIAGISADGQKFLIVGYDGAPYLWNQGDGTKQYIVPGSEYVDGELVLSKEGALHKHEEYRAELEKKYTDASGDSRLALLMDQNLRLAPGFIVQGSSGDYMGLSHDRILLWGLLDCRDGKWYCSDRGTPTLPVIDGKSVTQYGTEAKLWDVESGETTDIDFGMPGWAVLCARFLQDGSICGVLQDRGKTDKRNGQDTTMVVLPPDGIREEYPLAKWKMGSGFSTLITSGDSSKIIAFSITTIQRDRPFLIDRISGEVSVLTRQLEEMKAIPLSDCLDENGKVARNDEDATCVWYPMAEMNDGTILAMDLSLDELLLIDPSSLQIHILIDEAGLMELSEYRMSIINTPVPFSGNGVDVFPLRRLDKYLHLVG